MYVYKLERIKSHLSVSLNEKYLQGYLIFGESKVDSIFFDRY